MDKSSEAQTVIMSYIDINPIATLGTINPDGSPHGSIVYICTDAHRPVIYFLTKSKTAKYQNLQRDNRVSLTITHPSENSTIQANGIAKEIQDPQIIDTAMHRLTALHVNATDWLPPIAKIRAGAYVLISIEVQWARLAEYQGMSIGDERIFTQMTSAE